MGIATRLLVRNWDWDWRSHERTKIVWELWWWYGGVCVCECKKDKRSVCVRRGEAYQVKAWQW